MDLVRAILMETEDHAGPNTNGWLELELEGYESDDVSYHVQLLEDAGLIEAMNQSTLLPPPQGWAEDPRGHAPLTLSLSKGEET